VKITLLANDTTYTYNLRKEILARLIEDGHPVEIVSEILLFEEELTRMGCSLTDLEAGRHGTNPLSDLLLLEKYVSLLRKSKPDLVLSYNIKPNVYGGMACRLLHIPYLVNITGLGTALECDGRLQKLTIKLYRAGAAGAECVFFQNRENERFFREKRILSRKTGVRLLPGSGVALKSHPLLPYPDGDKVQFLFVSRILKGKGIDLYLSAARKFHAERDDTVFHVCGMCDDPAYDSILRAAQRQGFIEYHGQQKEMRPFFAMADCLVHPSWYPEGMSNVLLEAAASGRPVITTDRSGCREAVEDGVTGFVVPVRDEAALTKAIGKMLDRSREERKAMGLAGRAKMEREFDRQIVVDAYMAQIDKLG